MSVLTPRVLQKIRHTRVYIYECYTEKYNQTHGHIETRWNVNIITSQVPITTRRDLYKNHITRARSVFGDVQKL